MKGEMDMTIKRCVLCDGKIVNKRCSDCGMDYSRWDDHYHLNEEGCLECVGKNQAAYQNNRNKAAMSAQRAVRISEEEKRRREKAIRDARTKKQNAKANQRTRAEYGAEKPKKRGKKIVLAIFLLGLLSEIAGTVFENNRTAEVEPVPEYEAEISTNDAYAYVVDEMPEDGEYYEIELGKGSYYGAEQIPVGVYTVTLLNDGGYGNVGLYDDRNLIQYFEYLDCEDVTVLEDVRIYEGTKIEIEGKIWVSLKSENAQIDQMKPAKNNPALWSVPVPDTMVCGEDFDPGFYDLWVERGYGVITRTKAGAESYDWYTWLDSESPEETIYRNQEFLEGDVIAFDESSSDDFRVQLSPCEAVYR